MKRMILLSLISIPACYGGERAMTGQCPTGEVCSTLTPNGLHFIGKNVAETLLLTGPAPTAIGGTQEVALQYDRGDGILTALDLPYSADDDGGIGVTVDHTLGSVVTVKGVGSRTNYLRIVDPSTSELFDRKQLTGADISSIELAPLVYEALPTTGSIVWVAGDIKLGVALYGGVQTGTGPYDDRIVDTSMLVTLSGASRPAWDTLQFLGATVGSYPVSVTAGNKPTANLDLTVVDHPDALAAAPVLSETIAPGTHTVCFDATNAGRYVAGLSNWAFSIANVALDHGVSPRNCTDFTTTATTGTVTIHATVANLTADKTFTLSATGARLIPKARRTFELVPTVGDRAAM